MDCELTGKTALVTGSSRGIGRAIAEQLAAEGCRVAIHGRHTESAAETSAVIPNSVFVAGDVTRPDEAMRVVDEATTRLGRLDILVCNVGGGRSVAPGTETFDEWQRVFALNLWSTTNTVEAARRHLVSSRGAVVCVSSICGMEVVHGAPLTYSAAKAALHAYVRGMARPLGVDRVRINAVIPGNILFEGSVWSKKLETDGPAVHAMLDREVPLGRLGTPSDVAAVVVQLVSPRSGFVTGALWVVDGGQVRSIG